uniref:Putative salivary kunitz domain protein n=1 Tax=Ixodes ricinus TaxID=34613 RepID=A0A0K8RDY0_IXORI
MISVNMKIKYLCIFIAAALGFSECGTSENNTDVCKMNPPYEPGRAIIPGWFYNGSIDLCQYYEFGAVSAENEIANRFSSLSDCSKTCRRHVPRFCFDTPKGTEKVEHPTKWTYNSTSGKCVRLYWNAETTKDSNVFDKEADCLDICRDPDFGPCAQLPTDTECRGNGTLYYRYNRTSQTCYLDSKYLCPEGDNAFLTLDACYARCGRFVKNKCKLPAQDLGMCSQYGDRFIFNPKNKKCEKYFGCDHHGIGFYEESECTNACKKDLDRRCLMKPDKGKLGPWIGKRRWYYDINKKECEKTRQTSFWKGTGKTNLFATKEECEKLCKHTHEATESSTEEENL